MSKDPNVPVAVNDILLPSWYADIMMRRKRQIQKMIEKSQPGYQEEQDKRRKDTKPAVHVDLSDPHRPVIIFGGKGMWYEDMKEKVNRLREKPDPKLDPSRPRHNPKEDVAVALDRRKRRARGTSVFHIKNNPLSREE